MNSAQIQTMTWGIGGEHVEEYGWISVDSRGWAKYAYGYVYLVKICPYLSQHVSITFSFLGSSELFLTGKKRYDIFILPWLISKQLHPLQI